MADDKNTDGEKSYTAISAARANTKFENHCRSLRLHLRECVELCNDIIREELQEVGVESEKKDLPTPREIKAILDEYVIGQDQAYMCCPSLFITTTSGQLCRQRRCGAQKATFC